jgi:hypothetical protein
MDELWKRSSRAANDNVFGPQSETYSDVTIRLQENVFAMGPSAVLLLVTPFYVTYYSSLPVAIAEKPLVFAKLVGLESSKPVRLSINHVSARREPMAP